MANNFKLGKDIVRVFSQNGKEMITIADGVTVQKTIEIAVQLLDNARIALNKASGQEKSLDEFVEAVVLHKHSK
ncbi:MAG: hypothetical protein RR338_03000 [Clostridia bacterium]